MKKFSTLKLVSLALAGVGMLIANELQKREIREAVEDAITEREAQKTHVSPIITHPGR